MLISVIKIKLVNPICVSEIFVVHYEQKCANFPMLKDNHFHDKRNSLGDETMQNVFKSFLKKMKITTIIKY